MEALIALFPLQIVVFPGERLPLHIYELRYRELIQDCEDTGITFGIPTFIDGKLAFGTEIQLEKVAKVYPSGEKDIVCSGQRVFRISRLHNPMEGKQYAGADVVFVDNVDDGTQEQKTVVCELIDELYTLLGVAYDTIDVQSFDSFLLGHRLGLNLKQEYQLLQIPQERERLLFIEEHLNTIIPVLEQVNKTKEIIQLNGHFRNFDPLDFTDLKF